MRAVLSLCFFLSITFAAAGIGALFMPGAWYASLEKPPLTPANSVFGPVWTLLYLLMAVAAWLVYRRANGLGARWPLALYAAQLALNMVWTALFFGWQSPLFALADIVALWLLIAATIYAFARVSRAAAALLAPYLAWVTFATYLNAGFWLLNRA